MGDALKSKTLYKILLGLLKVLPALTALFYFISTLFSICGIELPILSTISGQSILSILFMYIASYVFRFCSYHRMFLHYIVIIDIINYIDYNIGIPINDKCMLMLISLITAIFLFLTLYLHLKSKKNETDTKESITSNNR